jgi:hypothetical protein
MDNKQQVIDIVRNVLHVVTACDLIQEIFALIFNVLKAQINLANAQLLLCQLVPEVASLLVDLSVQVLEESKVAVSFYNTLVQFLLKCGIDNKCRLLLFWFW